MTCTKSFAGSLVILTLCAGAALAQSDLAAGFRNPPDQAKPHTWWHWMNGNITREGITADLESMKQIGLGGAQLFNVSESIPDGPIKIMSPEWLDLVQFAASEASRLGLELCMHNCPGWSSSGGPWIKPEQAMQMVVTSETIAKGPAKFTSKLAQPAARNDYYRDICVLAFPTPKDDTTRIKDIPVKSGIEYRYGQDPALDALPDVASINRKSIVDLTSKLGPDGSLDWQVPEGSWTIIRFGHTLTGAQNAPSPASGRGLECDKMSKEALDAHWAGMMGPILAKLGPLAGKTLNNSLIDSYEMGGQNWTPRFREEFTKRRGYDPLLYLPTLTGRIVEKGEISERFLWDYRRTIADLFADNYYSHFAQICRKNGLLTSIEPYDGPFECMLTGRDADIPMGEFWVGSGESTSCRLAASVGHTYGQKIIGAEAFTAFPDLGKWQNHPGNLKAVGDLMYTVGINRYIIHRYAHQPWKTGVQPGMTMGQWGTHFERTNTWWNQGTGWIQYLARCQYLLQQCLFSADVCYFTGDAAPNGAPMNLALKARGYDYDAINADVLLRRASVKDGRLVLPDGMSYRLMVLPETTFMTPTTLKRVAQLVGEGLTVLGAPPTKSPSLANYPESDTFVAALAAQVWGASPAAGPSEHAFEKGRVITGKSPEEVLAAAGVIPDCTFANTSGKMTWIHRRLGETQIYFLSNQANRSQEVECTFRVTGLVPELWHADTGEIEQAPIWNQSAATTTVPIRLDPSGSVFVVFRAKAGKTGHLVALTAPEKAAAPKPPAIKILKAAYEAIDGAGGADVTAQVTALALTGQTSIPADNGIFGDPASLHVKRLTVTYTLDGKETTRTVKEHETLELIDAARGDLPIGPMLRTAANDQLDFLAFQPGNYVFRDSAGKDATVAINSVPVPIAIDGPWNVTFPPHLGAPPRIQLDTLASWTAHKDPGVRYFSGTAEYTKDFDVPTALVNADHALYLDLGTVKDLAQVALNGRDLGVIWKPPFRVDISSALKPGKNSLSVKITNQWVNRLIGDEQLPEDVEWRGITLAKWPQWLLDGSPRPSKERVTFTTWRHHTKDSTLLESGLLGPVFLRPAVRTTLPPSSN